MSAPDNKRYCIKTVADFMQVPVSSREACLRDFMFLLSMHDCAEEIEALLDEVAGVKGAASFKLDSFHWVDDDITGISSVEIARGDEVLAAINCMEPQK